MDRVHRATDELDGVDRAVRGRVTDTDSDGSRRLVMGPIGPERAATIQRLAGNRAMSQLVRREHQREEAETRVTGKPLPTTPTAATVQRWSLMDGLRRFGSWVSGLVGGGKEKPDKGTEAEAQGENEETVAEAPKAVAPEEEREAKPTHPSEPRPGFDLAGGQQILTKAFSGVKTIVPGKIEVLDATAFAAAYDKIYGKGPYSWAKYVVPKYGSLNGFAYEGINYINKASAGLHTIVHEMLHNNTASDWRGVVGSRWDEGATEVLTQQACALFNEPAPTCYPGESPVVAEAIANGLSKDDLAEAYLNGGGKKKVADWVDAHCTLSWAEVKAQMEAQNWAAAKAGLALKTTTATPPTTTGTPVPVTTG